MLWARHKDKVIRAEPGLKASCDLCGEELIPKCGEIKIWHWAHKALSDCDEFKENETKWHLDWKLEFPEQWREFKITKGKEAHRADVLTNYQMVIEFQHSSLNYEKMKERENFYRYMVWVFDCRSAESKIEESNCEIRWYAPRRDFSYCKNPVYLDFGGWLLRVWHIEKEYNGDIPIFSISGEYFKRSHIVNDFLSIPKHLLVCCPGYNRAIPYGTCLFHREENDPTCFKKYWPLDGSDYCEQHRFPYQRGPF